ncbi:alpha/beta hydrolase [Aquabacterium sp.]|uniref:alpha/beta hydrolase n=1 Tax=Aquabacterium sp. TaxID=1872578 RepID=UPI002C5A4AA5|nr:alpha/beta hydrolase [Aquabacterium sp.]HSW08784.1 alpha/beta hydrolase [Aquabacterium sp.]
MSFPRENTAFGTAPLEPAIGGFLVQAAGQPPLESLPLDVARQSYRELAGALGLQPPQALVRDLAIAGPGGALPLRCYTPMGSTGPLPVLVFLHGGGWVIGDLETHDAVCRTLCQEAGLLVVAVDYRRAPEHCFPAAPDDAEAALRWVAAHAAELGGDPARLALAGDSAGAQLAAVAAQRVAPGIPLRGLGLIYPAAQHYSEGSPSYAENGEGKFLTSSVMRWFMDAYLGKDAALYQHPEVALLRSQRLNTLPPTWIATAGHDPLRDEGLALARALAAAGVPLTQVHEASAIHACIHFTALSPAGGRLLAGLASWLRETV